MTNPARLAETQPVFESDPKRRRPYFKLHYLFSELTEDKLLAQRLAIQAHTWIIGYYQSGRRLKSASIRAK